MTQKRPKRPRDINRLAKSIIEVATGEADARQPKAGKAQAKTSTRSKKAK